MKTFVGSFAGLLVVGGLLTVGFTGCGGPEAKIKIDGSSTVEPISSAVAEKFMEENPKIAVNVGTSGTGGGFKKFLAGETDINDASRPIKQTEIDKAKKEGIEFIELKVAIDGLSVVVHKDNDWCKALTIKQLKALWESGSKLTTWKELGDIENITDWPDEKIELYGPGTDSGTFDYFTEEICGKKGNSRSNYQASENDDVIVRGVKGNKHALGYFGFAYYSKNKDALRAVAIVPKGKELKDAVLPTPETIGSNQYSPLSRPLFLYVRKDALKRPEVKKFVTFYLNEGQALVSKFYVKLSKADLDASKKTLETATK